MKVQVGDLVTYKGKVYEVEALSGPETATIREPGTNNWFPIDIDELSPVKEKADGEKSEAKSDSSNKRDKREKGKD